MNKVVIFDSIDVEAAVNNMAFQLNVMRDGDKVIGEINVSQDQDLSNILKNN